MSPTLCPARPEREGADGTEAAYGVRPGRDILQPDTDGFDGPEVDGLPIGVVGALAVVPDVVAPAGGLGLYERKGAPASEVQLDIAVGDGAVRNGARAFESDGEHGAGTVSFDLDAERLTI